MRKYGKYESRPEASVPKRSKAKHMILRTYFTSVLCLVLCVSMFLGTSYAWFTSEVNNTGNEIYVGMLKVGLYKREDGIRQDLASSDSNAAKLFDDNIRWEPGYTTLETIEVINLGDLAFKYVLTFTDGTLADGGDLEAVAKHFDVWVFDHLNKTYTEPASYDAITTSTDWVNVGTLADVLAGTPVLENKIMVTVRDDDAETPANDRTTDGVATADTYTIALHMKESADASVMGCRLNLNVKLMAYQMASEQEEDDLGAAYDNVVPASGLKDLAAALEAGENVVLLSDTVIDRETAALQMFGGVLDGSGNTIVYSGDRNSNGNSVGVLTASGGTVSNLTIDGGDHGRALYVTRLSSDLFVSGCTLSGAYAFNVNSAEVTGKTMTFVDTVFKSWVSYANVMDHAYFTGCTFEGNLKAYGDTTLTNCKFTDETLDVSALQSGETITLINCTYNGALLEMVVLKANGEEITVEGSSGFVIADGILVAGAG